MKCHRLENARGTIYGMKQANKFSLCAEVFCDQRRVNVLNNILSPLIDNLDTRKILD